VAAIIGRPVRVDMSRGPAVANRIAERTICAAVPEGVALALPDESGPGLYGALRFSDILRKGVGGPETLRGSFGQPCTAGEHVDGVG
jgi:hypothetical protein